MSDIQVGKVDMIGLDTIVIEDRAREEMGDLDSLEANMKESGLISPLAVKENPDGTYKLLAGERRFLVLQKNKVDVIPVRIYDDDLTKLEMKVIEKSENFHRKDMEYWEFDSLTLDIHEMQQQLHGVKAPGPDQSGWSLEDTGGLIGDASKAAVSMSIKRAEAREAFPDLFDNCKTASDASKVLKQVDEALIKHTIAQKLESEGTNETLQELSKHFIVNSFFKGVKEIPDGIMHLVEIDPPYSIDIAKAKKIDGVSKYQITDYNEISKSSYMDGDLEGEWRGMNEVFKECYRVMADHSWLICWFAPEPWFNLIYEGIRNAGFETTRMCGIWTKPSGQSKRPEMHLANTYEMFFYAWKGRPALNKAGRSNNFVYSPVPSNQKVHETERPTELMTDIYDTFAFPGSRILIPFLGSGNGLIAAHGLGMSAVGFELGKGYKDSFLVKVHGMK